jgi:hypothetical protein
VFVPGQETRHAVPVADLGLSRGEHMFVILSEAKNLVCGHAEQRDSSLRSE